MSAVELRPTREGSGIVEYAVSGRTYVVFEKGAVVKNLPIDQQPGVTFGGLLNGAASSRNDERDFGVDRVDVFEPGVPDSDGSRTVWYVGQKLVVSPTHDVRIVEGSNTAVSEVITKARERALQLQAAAKPLTASR